MGNVSRRDFIKGLAAGAVSVGALGLANTAGAVAFADEASKGSSIFPAPTPAFKAQSLPKWRYPARFRKTRSQTLAIKFWRLPRMTTL